MILCLLFTDSTHAHTHSMYINIDKTGINCVISIMRTMCFEFVNCVSPCLEYYKVRDIGDKQSLTVNSFSSTYFHVTVCFLARNFHI